MTGPDGRPGDGPDGAEPEYAPPVDPWANVEAEHLDASGTSVPMSSPPVSPPSVSSPSVSSPPVSPQPVVPPSVVPDATAGRWRSRFAYRKPILWAGAAGLAVVVLVSAAALVLRSWSYPALDYRPQLADIGTVAAPISSAFAETHVAGDRTYVATAADDGTLLVVAVATDTGKEVWRSSAAGTAPSWERMVGLPGKDAVAVFTATESATSSRRMVILGEAGRKLWERRIGGPDDVIFAGDTVVLAERAEKRVLGLALHHRGKANWEKRSPQDTHGGTNTTIVAVTTVDDVSGPAGPGGIAFAPDLDDDQRFVLVGADRSAQVFDAASGELVTSRPNVADPGDSGDAIVAHNGRLLVASDDDGYRISAYDLEEFGEPRVLYTAPDSNRRLTRFTSCGADRVCFIDTPGYDAATAEVVAVDAAKGGRIWRTKVADASDLVPVGTSVLVGRNSSPATVSLLDAEGAPAWERPGAAARIDGGNLLYFATSPSSYADDVSLAGEHLGDEPHQLGPLRGARTTSCSWNDAVIACAGEENFVLRRFVD